MKLRLPLVLADDRDLLLLDTWPSIIQFHDSSSLQFEILLTSRSVLRSTRRLPLHKTFPDVAGLRYTLFTSAIERCLRLANKQSASLPVWPHGRTLPPQAGKLYRHWEAVPRQAARVLAVVTPATALDACAGGPRVRRGARPRTPVRLEAHERRQVLAQHVRAALAEPPVAAQVEGGEARELRDALRERGRARAADAALWLTLLPARQAEVFEQWQAWQAEAVQTAADAACTACRSSAPWIDLTRPALSPRSRCLPA
jgi:hypothetical protein